MVQNEVRWALEAIAAEWPGGAFEDEDVVRIDRHEPELLETGERTKTTEFSRHAAIAVSRPSRTREPLGTEFNYNVETTLDIRIRGSHVRAGGTISSDDEFQRLVNYTQAALDARRKYPSIKADDPIGHVTYLEAIVDGPKDISSNNLDDFANNIEVRLNGRQDPDKR